MKRNWTIPTALALWLTVAGTTMALAPTAPAVPAAPTAEPVLLASGTISVEGTLEYNDLEGGFYTVNGWALIGDEKIYSAMQGQKVIVTGQEFTGMSTRMVKQLEVSLMAQEVAAAHTSPAAVTVQGKGLTFDQGPVAENGVLMLPLRSIVEAAGGSVEWVAATKTVNVTLPDRKASFTIGEAKAELNENGHMYLVRNLLPMAQAPVIRNGRTLISADAVTRILGLTERVDLDGSLDLVR